MMCRKKHIDIHQTSLYDAAFSARYSDSAYTMSQWSTSLEPGVDCPDKATYLSAANWMGPDMSRPPDPRRDPSAGGHGVGIGWFLEDGKLIDWYEKWY